MPPSREFLGLEKPALGVAADYLFTRYSQNTVADLSGVVVVVPGGRAGRRLLEILVDRSETRQLMFTPPAIETVGKFPERLYRPKRPFASDLSQRLAWAETLRSASPDQISPVIPHLPTTGEVGRWIELGDLLRRQHQELAANGLNFADVVKLAGKMDGFTEGPRWSALSELQTAYLRRLDALDLWDVQTARLVAVQQHECATDRDIVLVGTVDINATLKQMLDQVADRVTSLVFAPSEWRERFDDYGCLIPESWTTVATSIATEQVLRVDGPAAQAESVRQVIASFTGRYAGEDIVIGVPDESLIPDIQRIVASSGLNTRWGPGRPLLESPTVRLLQAVAKYVDQGRFADFAALVRHEDISAWLANSRIGPTLLEELDRYQMDHFPSRLSGDWLGKSPKCTELRRAWNKIHELLRTLEQPPRPLAEWSQPILEMLADVYGSREFDRTHAIDRMVLAACESIRDLFLDYAQVPLSLAPAVSASTTIRWLMDDLQRESVPPLAGGEAIELLGWLELPLDDAPALIVTSFNEGFVSSSVNSDLFLPNTLRRQLGITDNDHRYARDVYAVNILTATRESVHFIVARRNREGEPLVPSRLLFATDEETAARRALQFFGGAKNDAAKRLSLKTSDLSQNQLVVPHPRPLERPLTKLSVTSFRDYLACPYRFYLKHVLRLEAIDDGAQEMDGRAFGILAHDVLSKFGMSPVRDSTDAAEISAFLEHELTQSVAERLGEFPLPAVFVQIEQLKRRLQAYAAVQADWAEQGWRIESTEVTTSDEQPATIDVDGKPFQLRGRIDRIDVHAVTGERVIWDYKSSDSGLKPEETHQTKHKNKDKHKKEWIDLQLPLYRYLAKALGLQGPLQLGYILLPKDTNHVEMVKAEWTEEVLQEADETARRVIRAVRQQLFWPPTRPPPVFSEDLARICQDEILERATF